jgi:hypothetical protein
LAIGFFLAGRIGDERIGLSERVAPSYPNRPGERYCEFNVFLAASRLRAGACKANA